MPTVADIETVAKNSRQHPGRQAPVHGALIAIPILAPMQAEPEWLTLAEAGYRVRITEVGEEGSVPDLKAALAQKAEAHDVQSPTGAMLDFYARYEPEIAKAREALKPIPGQPGAVAYVAGRWAGLDLLAGPRLFSRVWSRLCGGYAADALRRAPAARHVPAPSRLVKMLTACPVEPAPAASVGAVGLAGEKLTGASPLADERVAQLMVLRVDALVDRRNVRSFGSNGRPLRAVDKLGVDLVFERIATPLIHVMEDTLDRGALPLDTSRRAELEYDDCAPPGVEDKEIDGLPRCETVDSRAVTAPSRRTRWLS